MNILSRTWVDVWERSTVGLCSSGSGDHMFSCLEGLDPPLLSSKTSHGDCRVYMDTIHVILRRKMLLPAEHERVRELTAKSDYSAFMLSLEMQHLTRTYMQLDAAEDVNQDSPLLPLRLFLLLALIHNSQTPTRNRKDRNEILQLSLLL